MVDISKPPFRYTQIAQELRARIRRGDYPQGRLPAERMLSAEFGVQRDTLRRALEVLTAEGLLRRDSTRGTAILPGSADAGREGTRSDAWGGVLLVLSTSEFTAPLSAVFRGLARRLAQAGVPVYWHDPGDKGGITFDDAGSGDPFLPSLGALRRREIRGLVVWPQVPILRHRYHELREHLPLVLLDRRVPGFEADFVGFQDFAGGRAVTEHLLRVGHRRIAFISCESQATTVQERHAGYVAALQHAGVVYDPALTLHHEGGGHRLTNALLSPFLAGTGDPVTAVVCANDIVAARVIAAVRADGRRIPDDLAVTGFGDLLPTVLDAYGLTTVAQPFEELGRVAGELMETRLRNADESQPPVSDIELPMHLIVRESCGSRR